MHLQIESELMSSSHLFAQMAASMTEDIQAAAQLMVDTLRQGGKILLCGNGGSATTAQHMAGEIVGRFRRERPGWAAIALPADGAILTAVGNDYGFDEVFARQVEALATEADLFIGFSTSGISNSVVQAMRKAQSLGAATMAMTGEAGGSLQLMADITIRVPSSDTPRIQEAHITAGHIICDIVEKSLFESSL